MMTEISADEIFQRMLDKLYEQSISNDPAKKFQEQAWKRFQEMGLPTHKTEVFQYIRLRKLYSHSFESAISSNVNAEMITPYILPECSQSVIVMINGHYNPDLSRLSSIPKRLVILSLNEASRTYGSFLNNHWNKLLKDESDPFAMLNAALYAKGLFIYTPPKTLLEVPLQILHISTKSDVPLLMTPRINAVIGSQSQLDFISTQTHLSDSHALLNAFTDFVIDEDAHVRYFQSAFDLSKKIWHFDAFRANVKRNSTLKTILTTEGSTSARYDYRVTLSGENAEANLNGLCILSQSDEVHANILMDHQAPNCRSMQLFKSTLNDTSRSSFEGKILVHQAAQKTEAFQLNNNLLLSDKAKADSKPNLEIFADDVKASHGATVGQLDPEQLFYLKSRGYSESEAKNLLVYAFCKEVLDLIPFFSLSDDINHRTRRYLSQETCERRCNEATSH